MSQASGSSLNCSHDQSAIVGSGMRRDGVAYLVQSGLGGFLLLEESMVSEFAHSSRGKEQRGPYLFASSLVKATDEHVELLDRYRHGDGLAARQREVGGVCSRFEVVVGIVGEVGQEGKRHKHKRCSLKRKRRSFP